jgi:hypothetical protein
MDPDNVRSTRIALKQKRRALSINPELSSNFTLEELNNVLLNVKSEKAAGFDGVYPEFIKNAGDRTKEWSMSPFSTTYC